jgi:hypothetical protein
MRPPKGEKIKTPAADIISVSQNNEKEPSFEFLQLMKVIGDRSTT